jgi:tRNA (guanine37-N1)-methyltransferase
MIRFYVLSLFPEFFASPLEESILKRAREAGLLDVNLVNIRDYAHDKHHMTDDTPYGGGPGMVMKPEPLFESIEAAKQRAPGAPVILLTPQGETFCSDTAQKLAESSEIILVCGRYEGVDERVRTTCVDMELSIGNYVLCGGELAALVVIEATCRFVPGILGHGQSAWEDSFSNNLLEYPQYTRPPEYRGLKVPQILLSGDHKKIERWRREQSLIRTFERMPELLEKADLTPEDLEFIARLKLKLD